MPRSQSPLCHMLVSHSSSAQESDGEDGGGELHGIIREPDAEFHFGNTMETHSQLDMNLEYLPVDS